MSSVTISLDPDRCYCNIMTSAVLLFFLCSLSSHLQVVHPFSSIQQARFLLVRNKSRIAARNEVGNKETFSSAIPPFESGLTVKKVIQSTNRKYSHDPTIDRRKSPALWRYDLEYSIQPVTKLVDTSDSSNISKCYNKSSQLKSGFHLREPPELMSPAGGWPQLKAAVANGADAIYLGLISYSARARASNFDPDPSFLYQSSNDPASAEEYVPNEGRPASLAQAVKYCHKYRVRVYVAFNTLVFDKELHEVERLLGQVWDCGVDAVIVQDLAVAKIAKELVDRRIMSLQMTNNGVHERVGRGLYGAPMEIHASTQQTVTCIDGVEFAAKISNATRVVLGRELSLSEISQITNNTSIEIEAFVHGALCVSYSGQCFSSEAWGGRSANRGQCAQACRLPYGLIVNGELKHLSFDGIEGIMGHTKNLNEFEGTEKNEQMQYLLSPQDLCGLDQVDELVRAGVSCLKIEGRLKDATYVAATTRAYRKAIDYSWSKVMQEQGIPDSIKSKRTISGPHENVSRADLVHVFSRGQDENHDGLTPGFFEGPNHQRLVRGRSPRHRGVHLGRVISAQSGILVIKLDDRLLAQEELPIKLGDGIVVDRGLPQKEELGGPIYYVKYNSNDGTVAIRFGKDVERRWMENDNLVLLGKTPHSSYKHAKNIGSFVSLLMAPKGSHIWKTADADVERRMMRLAELDPPRSQAQVFVKGRVGEPLVVKIVDVRSGVVSESSTINMGVLQAAKDSGLDHEAIRKAIGSLGNSPWTLVDDDIDTSMLQEGSWCPLSWIKETRRSVLKNLEDICPQMIDTRLTALNIEARTDGDDRKNIVDKLLQDIRHYEPRLPPTPIQSIDKTLHVSVLARNYEQVDAVCRMIENSINAEMVVIDDVSFLDEIIIDFLEMDGMQAAVTRINELKITAPFCHVRVTVASPRILKPGEEGIWRTLLKLQPDAILVRSSGLLHRLQNLGGSGTCIQINSCSKEEGKRETYNITIPTLIGDFSLNAANALSAHQLLESGLHRITLSYELSAHAITELANLIGDRASQLEVVVHQHIPIFHTENCVFARFLSHGKSYQDCGHVCTRNTVHLRDQNGKDNLVLADMGCRNTVFMAESQSGLYSINDWSNAGIGQLRIELVDESAMDAINIVRSYLQYLSGKKHEDEVWRILKSVTDSNGRMGGVGVGSLRNSVERRSGEAFGSHDSLRDYHP